MDELDKSVERIREQYAGRSHGDGQNQDAILTLLAALVVSEARSHEHFKRALAAQSAICDRDRQLLAALAEAEQNQVSLRGERDRADHGLMVAEARLRELGDRLERIEVAADKLIGRLTLTQLFVNWDDVAALKTALAEGREVKPERHCYTCACGPYADCKDRATVCVDFEGWIAKAEGGG